MKKYILLLGIFSIGNQKGSCMFNVQAIILAAGKSTRFNTEKIKLAENICGQAMILFSTKLLQTLHIPTIVVVGFQQDVIKNIITAEHGDSIEFVVQEKQEGTGHALACTRSLWHNDHILVMNGDVPFVNAEILNNLYEKHIQNNAAISFVTSYADNTTTKSYGRVIETENNISIVEAKDFTGNTSKQYPINAGIYLINKNFLENYIATLNDYNANKEFYITDLVKIASQHNLPVTTVHAPFDSIAGINTLQELLVAEHIKKTELVDYWMSKGVRFTTNNNVYLDIDVTIGQRSFIGDGVHIRGNSIIGKDCTVKEYCSLENVILEDNVIIHPHSVLRNAYIKSGTEVGPFAYMRANVMVGENSIIGSFVEVKNSTIDNDSKAKHLTYIGDSIIGSHVNIGAGTITCNYNGVTKHKTIIKDYAFIGSNNTIIAPVTIGNNAYTAAGSTITTDVPDDALAIARMHQVNKADYSKKLKKISSPKECNDPEPNSLSFIGARVIHSDSPADEQ